jgi:cysteine desulfurase/selenocysteine lyase
MQLLNNVIGRNVVRPGLVPHSDFLGLDGVTHLYSAAECPMLRIAADAMIEYSQWKSRAEGGRAHHNEVTASCKAGLAHLLGVSSEEIALLGSASEAVNAVAGIIDFRPGDNMVINDLEFPSVALPWLRLRKLGIEVRVVRHQNWEIPASSLLSVVDGRTRLVALSHVSYVNGWRHDVETISVALQGSAARLLLDATQSLGVFPVQAALADFAVSSTYKWLLGTHGLGVLYVNQAKGAALEPSAIGWYSVETAFTVDRYERYRLRSDAGRFETGYLNFPAIYALESSVTYLLGLGTDKIGRHAHALGDSLIEGLHALGLTVTTPTDHARRGASVTFLHEQAAVTGGKLAARNVHVWAGDGRVRASTHAFNNSQDVERYLEVLSDALS